MSGPKSRGAIEGGELQFVVDMEPRCAQSDLSKSPNVHPAIRPSAVSLTHATRFRSTFVRRRRDRLRSTSRLSCAIAPKPPSLALDPHEAKNGSALALPFFNHRTRE